MHAPAAGQSGLEELVLHSTNLRMDPGVVMKLELRQNMIDQVVLSMEFAIQDKYCYADKTTEDVHTPTTTLKKT